MFLSKHVEYPVVALDAKGTTETSGTGCNPRRILQMGFVTSQGRPGDVAKLRLLVWEIGRLPVSLISGAAVAAMLAASSNLAWTEIAVQALPITLVTMAAFAFNDLYDRDKDSIAGAKRKPIADGRVTVKEGHLFAALLSVCALALAALVEEGRSLYVIVAALFGVATYSIVAQRLPIVKGLATAVLCCAPLAYGSEVAQVTVPKPIYFCFAAFVAGRELVLDVVHFSGDSRAGIHTLVAYLSPGISRLVGWTTMIASVAALTLYSHGIGRLGFAAALLSLAAAGWIGIRDEVKGVIWTRVTLLLGVISGSLSL
jgi:4-hydroxybenzoate polyprenyltransferase